MDSRSEVGAVMPIPIRESAKSTGIVQLGDVTAPATWYSGHGDILVIQFDSARLNDRVRIALSRYRAVSRPIPLKLPDQSPWQASVISFNSRDETFYVSLS